MNCVLFDHNYYAKRNRILRNGDIEPKKSHLRYLTIRPFYYWDGDCVFLNNSAVFSGQFVYYQFIRNHVISKKQILQTTVEFYCAVGARHLINR